MYNVKRLPDHIETVSDFWANVKSGKYVLRDDRFRVDTKEQTRILDAIMSGFPIHPMVAEYSFENGQDHYLFKCSSSVGCLLCNFMEDHLTYNGAVYSKQTKETQERFARMSLVFHVVDGKIPDEFLVQWYNGSYFI